MFWQVSLLGTFEQALQLTYLMWKLRCLNKPGADIGRLDVHLYPWFCRDIEEGKTTEEEALELLCDFWQLLNENDSGDTLINVMVGGKNQDGTDAGSRLSVLMLEATKRCKQSEPHINVRVHSGLAPRYLSGDAGGAVNGAGTGDRLQ